MKSIHMSLRREKTVTGRYREQLARVQSAHRYRAVESVRNSIAVGGKTVKVKTAYAKQDMSPCADAIFPADNDCIYDRSALRAHDSGKILLFYCNGFYQKTPDP